MMRRRAVLVALSVLIVITSTVTGTPCPSSGDPPTVLSNGTLYAYSNCLYPINASGLDLADVTMVFVNASPGSIRMAGSSLTRFTFSVFNATLRPSKIVLSVNFSVIDDLRITFRNCDITILDGGSPPVAIRSYLSATSVNMVVKSSAIFGQTVLAFAYFGGGATGMSLWENSSFVISQSNVHLAANHSSVVYCDPSLQSINSFSLEVCCQSTVVAGTLLQFIPSSKPDSAVRMLTIVVADLVKINLSYQLVTLDKGLDLLTDVTISIESSQLIAAMLLWCVKMTGSRQRLSGATIVVKNSTMRFLNQMVYIGNPTVVTGCTLLLINTTLSTGAEVFATRLGNGVSSPLFSNFTLAATNSLINSTSSSCVIAPLQPTEEIRNVYVAFSNTTVTAMSVFTSSDNTSIISNVTVLAVSGSQFQLGDAFFSAQADMTAGVVVWVISSYVTGSSISILSGSSVGHLDVLVANSVFYVASIFFSLQSITVIDGPVNIRLDRNSSMTFGQPSSTAITSDVLSFYTIDNVRGPISAIIEDSSITMTVSSTLFLLALVRLVAVSFLPGTLEGTFNATIRNSSVMLSQVAPVSTDLCAVLSAISVTSPSATSIELTIDTGSRIFISCAGSAAVVSSLQSSSFRFSLSASNGSHFFITTTARTLRSPTSKLPTGSFFLGLASSAVANSLVSIRNCTIACGLICQMASVNGNQGAFYGFLMIMLLGYSPAIQPPLLINVTVLVAGSNISWAADTLKNQPIEPRSLFSFANALNTAFILEGPLMLSADAFDGIFDNAESEGAADRLVLRNCGEIRVTTMGGSFLPVVQMVYAHGRAVLQGIAVESEGGCGLSSTASFESTRSLSATRSEGNPTRTISSAVHVRKEAFSSRKAAIGNAVFVVAICSGSATVALSVQALHAQMLISSCPNAAEAAQPDIASSPTQISIGRPEGGYDRGAVVGNFLLQTAFVVVSLFAVIAARRMGRTMADLGLPGLLYIPHSVLMVPTVTCATLLLAAGEPAASDAAVAIVGYAMAAGPVLALVTITVTRWFRARPVRVSLRRIKGSMLRGYLMGWYGRTTEYDSLPGYSGFVEQWDYAGVMDYVPHRQWFVALERMLGITTGVLAGLTALGSGWCKALNVLQSVVSVMFFVLLLVLRPYSVQADRWLSLSCSLLQSGTAVLGLLGADASELCSIVQLVACAVYMAGNLTWNIFDHCTRGLRLFRPSGFKKTRQMKASLLSAEELEVIIQHLEMNSPRENRECILRLLIQAACRRDAS